MKKEIIMICCILILVVFGDFITKKFSNNFFEEMKEDLISLENDILNQNNDIADLKKKVIKIQNKWNNKQNILACYLEHGELEKVGNKLVRIYAGIEVNQLDETVMEIEECNFVLEHINNKELFTFVNIL